MREAEKLGQKSLISCLVDLARERPLALAAWMFGFFLVLQFAQLDLRYAMTHGDWRSSVGTLIGRDFVNVFTAGHLAADRSLSIVYDVAAYQNYQLALFDGRVLRHNYSYTPVSFLYAWFFALTPYVLSYILWIGLTGAAFVIAARPYLRDAGLPGWLAVMTPAALLNVWAGHYGFLFGALWLGAWAQLDRRPRLAGVLVGLLIVKPHLAILMPLLLAARGAWRAFFYAGLTVAVLIAISGLTFGWQLWADYVTDTLFLQAAMVERTGDVFLRIMPTAYPAFRLAGLAPPAAWLLQAVCAVCAMGALLRWMPQDPRRAGLAAATATFLVLPYAFNYDMTIVGIAAVILLHRAPEDAPVQRLTAALVLILPAVVFFTNAMGLPIAPPLLLLLLGGLLGRRWHVTNHAEREGSQPILAEQRPA